MAETLKDAIVVIEEKLIKKVAEQERIDTAISETEQTIKNLEQQLDTASDAEAAAKCFDTRLAYHMGLQKRKVEDLDKVTKELDTLHQRLDDVKKVLQECLTIKLVLKNMIRKKSKQLDFTSKPNWTEVQAQVQKELDDLKYENYRVYTTPYTEDRKEEVNERNWATHVEKCKDGKEMTLVVVSAAQAFSEFDSSDVYRLLGLTRGDHVKLEKNSKEAELVFPYEEIDLETALPPHLNQLFTWRTMGDLMTHVGNELAMRCLESGPASKEKGRSELISPILFAAAAFEGGVKVVAEWSVHGTLARGSIDYVMFYKDFSIIVIEGKLFDRLEDHLGQLGAEIRSAREKFKIDGLGKRKMDDEDDKYKQVPSIGIITNGLRYVLYKFCPATKQLFEAEEILLRLTKGIAASEAMDEAKLILCRLVPLLRQQKQVLETTIFKRQKIAEQQVEVEAGSIA